MGKRKCFEMRLGTEYGGLVGRRFKGVVQLKRRDEVGFLPVGKGEAVLMDVKRPVIS